MGFHVISNTRCTHKTPKERERERARALTRIKRNGAHSRLYGSFECFELISDNTKMWMNRFIARRSFFVCAILSVCLSHLLYRQLAVAWACSLWVQELPRNGANGWILLAFFIMHIFVMIQTVKHLIRQQWLYIRNNTQKQWIKSMAMKPMAYKMRCVACVCVMGDKQRWKMKRSVYSRFTVQYWIEISEIYVGRYEVLLICCLFS